MTVSTSIAEAIASLSESAATMAAIVRGPADGDGAMVDTPGGQLPTLAKIAADLQSAAGTVYLTFATTVAMQAFTPTVNNLTVYNAQTASYYRWDAGLSGWVFARAAESARIDTLEEKFTKTAADADRVGKPILVEVDESDSRKVIRIVNEDGTTWLRLDQRAIDYIWQRLPLGLGAAPAGLFQAATVPRPPLGYRQSTSEEGFPATYVFRLDISAPSVAVAVTREAAELCSSDGQSLNLDGGTAASEIITTPPYPHRALTLKGSASGGPIFGGLTALDGSAITDLQPCFEAVAQNKDSPCTGMLRLMTALDLAASLEPPIRVTWASGAGGRNIAELAKGTLLYDNDMLLHGKAVEFLRSYGVREIVKYVHDLDQGEEDRSDNVSVAAWIATFTTYRQDKEADIRAITRQAEPVWHSMKALGGAPGTGGVGSPFIALAHYGAMKTLPRTTISHCDYFLKGTYGLGNEGVHATSLGQDLRGEYRAKARRRITQMVKAAVAAGIDPWTLTWQDMKTCLAVTGASRSGSTVTLDLLLPWDATSVVEDTATLPAANATGIVKGIKLAAGSGAVSSVAVTNPSTGVYKLQVGLSVAGAGTLRGGCDAVDTTTTDRSNAWTNFKAPSSIESIAVAGLTLDNWLIPFDISYL